MDGEFGFAILHRFPIRRDCRLHDVHYPTPYEIDKPLAFAQDAVFSNKPLLLEIPAGNGCDQGTVEGGVAGDHDSKRHRASLAFFLATKRRIMYNRPR